MINTNWAIDYIQQSKKQFVDATVTNDIIRKGLHEFIDKQTELTKIVSNNMIIFIKEFNTIIFKKN